VLIKNLSRGYAQIWPFVLKWADENALLRQMEGFRQKYGEAEKSENRQTDAAIQIARQIVCK